MGQILDRVMQYFSRNNGRIRVLMLGLPGAGKSTLLKKMKIGNIITTAPAMGVLVEEVSYKKVTFTALDVGACQSGFTCQSYPYTKALVFVIDSNNKDTASESRDQLHKVMRDPMLSLVGALLILANKQDLPGAIAIDRITDILELQSLSERNLQWHIEGCCAANGSGLYEGLDWLAHAMEDCT